MKQNQLEKKRKSLHPSASLKKYKKISHISANTHTHMLSRLASSLSTLIDLYTTKADSILNSFGIVQETSKTATMNCFHGVLATIAFYIPILYATGTMNPLSAVLSGSMEPTYFRGDMMFLTKRVSKTVVFENEKTGEKEKYILPYGDLKAGDVIVFDKTSLVEQCSEASSLNNTQQSSSGSGRKLAGNNNNNNNSAITSSGVVHRIISVHTNTKGETFVLTKGDNNQVDDRQFLYPAPYFLIPVNEKTFVGKVVFRIPWIGYGSIFVTEQLGVAGKIAILFSASMLAYYLEVRETEKVLNRTSTK